MTQAYEDWRNRADQNDLLATAITYGAILKRAGREHIGPCPACAGEDRFSINPGKNLWNCRGHGGGHGAVGMLMHIAGLSFAQTCETLTGEPNPSSNRPARPLSAEEQAARNRQRIESDRIQEQRRAEEERYQEQTTAQALAIWNGSVGISGTLAEKYLLARGIPIPDGEWPSSLRFHGALPYPKKPGTYPVLVCRVDDVEGNLTSIWRIFLRADGRKADLPEAKLGLGPSAGGMVRLNGPNDHIGICEGVETALGAWNLIGRKYPVWSGLSTAISSVELPLFVTRVTVFSDGDAPLRKKGHDYEPAIPAGRKAAEALRARLIQEGVSCSVAAEPFCGTDYLDVWNAI
jgi:putative DNA primase/helicase